MGVLAAAGLVVVLEGFRAGLYRQVGAYAEHAPAQLVVVREGVESMTGVRPSLPPEALGQLKAVPGVRETYPMVGGPSIFSLGDRKTPIYIVGYEVVGGPWSLKVGRNVQAPGEVVVDYSLARKYGLAVGGEMELLGKRFRVVGLSSGTSAIFFSYVFVGLEDAKALLGGTDQASTPSSLFFVELASGAEVARARQAVKEALPGASVFTPKELAEKDAAMIGRVMGSVIGLLVVVAYVVGILVIGITLYATVFERLREYGVMKAVGTRNSRLYRQVLGQATAFTVSGLLVGYLVAAGVAALLAWMRPQYVVVAWDGQVLLRAAVAAGVMASLASLIPIRQVAGVDPALVFRQ